MFQQVVHKGGELEINYIEIFQNDRVVAISVKNGYTEDHMIPTLFENFYHGGKYNAQI